MIEGGKDWVTGGIGWNLPDECTAGGMNWNFPTKRESLGLVRSRECWVRGLLCVAGRLFPAVIAGRLLRGRGWTRGCLVDRKLNLNNVVRTVEQEHWNYSCIFESVCDEQLNHPGNPLAELINA